MKSSLMIWHYVVNVKYTVKILSICMALLENLNFNNILWSGSGNLKGTFEGQLMILRDWTQCPYYGFSQQKKYTVI